MKTFARFPGVHRIALSIFGVLLMASFTASDLVIAISVAPNVLNIQSKGEVVTVHTDLAFGAVVAATVLLNGVEINSWKADNRGNFVAKFLMQEIKDLPLLIDGMNTLVLEGQTKDGLLFWGSQDIKVIDVVASGNK